MATKLDQNKVDSVMASGRKSLVNTMILSDAAEAQVRVWAARLKALSSEGHLIPSS